MSEVRKWEQQRNAMAVGLDWQFTTADTRIKLPEGYILERVMDFGI